MRDFEIKSEIKNKIYNELESFVEISDWKIRLEDEDAEDLRDELVSELNDRLTQTLNVIGYHRGLEIALALAYWNFEDAHFALSTAEDLGFNASYEWVTENDVVNDVVIDFMDKELNFKFI